MKELSTSEPRAHAENVRGALDEIVEHLRRDITKVTDPKAQALFETSAEVLVGLSKAFAHYQQKNEAAWR